MGEQVQVGATRIILKRGDITAEQADAIVNAANGGLLGGGGVDGAIHRAGGPAILEECRRIREGLPEGLPTGEAMVTTAGRLKARWVVHAVGPVWRGGGAGEPALLARAYRNSLARAAEHGARTIAFPAISTGIYGYPIEQAAPVALGVARDWARAHPDDFAEIRFVLFSDRDLAVYQRALSALSS